MISMTGYGYREYRDERVQLVTELRSYNNRYLDIAVNIPPFLSPLEPKIQEFLRDRVGRGRVEATIRVKELEEEFSVHLNENAAVQYAEALRRLREATNIEDEPKISHFLRLEGVLSQVKNRDLDWFEDVVMSRLSSAFEDFFEAKQKEGKATEEDIRRLLTSVESQLSSIENHVGSLEEKLKKTLQERFRELMEENMDENRLYQETAVMLMKYGIDEETVRMRSHIAQFKEHLGESSVVGKKLDFICQELNREINTIGSKSTVAEINRAVVEIKDSLEKIREQLRNVE